MKTTKLITQTILLVFLILLIFSFAINQLTKTESNNDQEVTSISIGWSAKDRSWNQTMLALIEDFENNNPHIKIIQVPINERLALSLELKQMYLLGVWPDIIQIENTQSFRDLELITPFPKEISLLIKNTSYKEDDDGNVWSLPTQSYLGEQYLGVYYNEALFNEYDFRKPTSYTDFLQLCEDLLKIGIAPLGLSGAQEESLELFFTLRLGDFLRENPNYFIDLYNKEAIIDENYLEIFEDYKYLVDHYVIKKWNTLTEAGLLSEFNRGRTAMMITDNRIHNLVEESPYLKLNFFFLPSKLNKHFSIIQNDQNSGWSLSQNILNDSRKEKAVFSFMNYFYSSYAKEIMNINGSLGPPIVDSSIETSTEIIEKYEETDQLLVSPMVSLFEVPYDQLPFLYDFFTYQNIAIKNYLSGEITIDELQYQLTNRWNSLAYEG